MHHILVYTICTTIASFGSWLTVVGSPGLSSTRALLLWGRGRDVRGPPPPYYRLWPALGELRMCILSCIGTSLAHLPWSLVDFLVLRLFLLIGFGISHVGIGVNDGCMNSNSRVPNVLFVFVVHVIRFVLHQFLVVFVYYYPHRRDHLRCLAHLIIAYAFIPSHICITHLARPQSHRYVSRTPCHYDIA
ncbi:hypothetical protein LXA43DRAFT_525010 [Ganoderma leucocontextum]|nr:hypothetical protein LXA43DRAFT_525010 [Ganoderma leucocontextum]